MNTKKIGFFTYFRTLNSTVAIGRNGLPTAFTYPFFSTVLLFLFIISMGGNAIPAPLVLVILCPSVYPLVSQAKAAPSLYRLLPIGRTRKTLFFFLSILVTILASAIVLIVFFALFGLMIAAIMLLATGNWTLDLSNNEFIGQAVGLQGNLLAYFVVFSIFGLSMIFAPIEKRSLSFLFSILIPIFIFVPIQILISAHHIQNGDLFLAFHTIPHSEAYLIAFAVISVGVLIGGIVRIVRFLKTKPY